jgi:hypothetical protein
MLLGGRKGVMDKKNLFLLELLKLTHRLGDIIGRHIPLIPSLIMYFLWTVRFSMPVFQYEL